jgi:hypothetical protein
MDDEPAPTNLRGPLTLLSTVGEFRGEAVGRRASRLGKPLPRTHGSATLAASDATDSLIAPPLEPFLSILTGCLISKSVAGGGDMQFASRTSIRWDGEQLYREMQGVDERLRSERRVTESKVAWRPAELRHIPCLRHPALLERRRAGVREERIRFRCGGRLAAAWCRQSRWTSRIV